MRKIELRSYFPDAWVRSLRGQHIDHGHYDPKLLLGGEDGDVYRPDGSVLLRFRHNVLPGNICKAAIPSLVRAAQPTTARGDAAGGYRERKQKADGTWQKARYTDPVLSTPIGFYKGPPRDPGCRATAYTGDAVNRSGWLAVQPLIRAVNEVFRTEAPDRYAAQQAVMNRTHPYWRIPDTVFTTVTVNRNFQTAVHQDKGDLKSGFGVMTVIEHRGQYDGGYLVFPKWRVAVDLRTTDVLLADVHEFHGNVLIDGTEGEYDRLSCIYYYRTAMCKCGDPMTELQKYQTYLAATQPQ
jgi:hypothetical protein